MTRGFSPTMMTRGISRRCVQAVLEQDGDAVEFRHQHPHVGDVECPSVTARHRHTKERHQTTFRHLRVTTALLTY